MNLTDFHERFLAAMCFAAFALLCVAVMFHTLTMALRGIFLYVVLPIVASGIAGALCGGPIVNRAKTRTMSRPRLRSSSSLYCSHLRYPSLSGAGPYDNQEGSYCLRRRWESCLPAQLFFPE